MQILFLISNKKDRPNRIDLQENGRKEKLTINKVTPKKGRISHLQRSFSPQPRRRIIEIVKNELINKDKSTIN